MVEIDICTAEDGVEYHRLKSKGSKRIEEERLEEIIKEDLFNWIEEHGRVPTTGDSREHDALHEDVARRIYGTWSGFLRQVGVHKSPTEYSGLHEDAINSLCKVAYETEGKLTFEKYREHSDEEDLGAKEIQRLFGRWSFALRAAGLDAGEKVGSGYSQKPYERYRAMKYAEEGLPSRSELVDKFDISSETAKNVMAGIMFNPR